MGENEIRNAEGAKSIFTVRNLLRAFSLLCIIFVFCPVFLVSCSGQEVNVSVMKAITGVTAYGERVVDPHPIMVIAILLPVAMFALLLIKQLTDENTSIFVLACAVADFVVWAIFNVSVKRYAKENYCECKTTIWFVFNIISLLLIIILNVFVVMKKMQLETDMLTYISGGGTRTALTQMSNAVSQMSGAVTQMAGNVVSTVGNTAPRGNVIGYCAKCGAPIESDCKFCTACGTPVPASLLEAAEAAEAARQAAEEAARRAAEEEAARRAAEEEAAARQAAESVAAQNIDAQAVPVADAMQAAPATPVAPAAPEIPVTPVVPATPVAPVTPDTQRRPAFCQQCGAPLSPNARFCEVCGTKVG